MKRAKRDLEKEFEGADGAGLKTVAKEARTVIAELCDEYVKDGGHVEDFLLLLQRAGYDANERTLRRWRANVRERGEALPGGGGRGRPRALTAEQEVLFVGYVFRRNVNNKIVQLSTCVAFLKKAFGITVVESTVHEYLTENGFSSQKMKTKAAGYSLSADALADMAFAWLKKEWRLLKKGEVWSIDVTLTGHRLDTYRSYSPFGGPPPLLENAISRFTNAVVTAISSLGDFFHSILFSYNQKFRRDRRRSSKRDRQLQKLDHYLEKCNVEAYRVVYVGKDKHEKRTYVPASVDIIQRFLDVYQIEPGSCWYSDNGKEFFPQGGSSLVQADVDHVAYPAAVHQYLSPNDNNHHSSAKAAWRAMKPKYENDVEACIMLLSCFDNDAHNVPGYFSANLQLDKQNPDLDQMRELIGGKKLRSNSYFKKCMYDYCIAFKKDGRGGEDGTYADELDGLYWQ